MPVMMGLITPICFCASGVLTRRLTDESYGIKFNGTTLSMTCFLISNIFIVVVALIFWSQNHFSI